MNGGLLHYGVKGMKWGVRKEYVPHPRKRAGQSITAKKTEKITKAIGVGALAIGVGYLAYKNIGRDYIGGMLKVGTVLHTVMDTDNIDYGRQFYASFLKKM